MNCVKKSGLEFDENFDFDEKFEKIQSTSKMIESISRAKKNIFELAFCNDWDFFITLTLSPDKLDRSNIQAFRKKFNQFIRNKKRLHGIDIKYLIVPELHSDLKNWHCHGFIKNIPDYDLHEFKKGDVFGSHISKKLLQGKKVYNWLSYSKKFGFCDLEPIESQQKAANYCCKYITKDLSHCINSACDHLYYASQGLKKSRLIKCGFSSCPSELDSFLNNNCYNSFENDYIKTWYFSDIKQISQIVDEIKIIPANINQ